LAANPPPVTTFNPGWNHINANQVGSLRIIDADGSNEKMILGDTKAPDEGGRVSLKQLSRRAAHESLTSWQFMHVW
jgi:hypothetical protein